MARVDVEVQSDAEAHAVWIDKKLVRLFDGKGGRDLPAGEHVITWIILGKPGQKATIIVSQGGVVLRKEQPVIGPNEHHHSGTDYFTI